MAYTTAAFYSHNGYLIWEPTVAAVIGSVFFTAPFGVGIHFRANKEIKESPPIRLNRKKRQVALPRWAGGSDFKLPFWGEEFFGFVYLVYVFTSFSVIGPFLLDGPVDDRGWAFFKGGLIALAVESLLFVPYLVFGLHLKKKNAPRLEYVYYPWEKLVAYIEKRDNIGPTIFTEQVMLTLAVPDPEDPETALAASSISVGHETAGIAQWESLRRFMEEGPEACPDPQNNDTLAHYKETCRKARQEKSTGAWLWKKVGDWFFQRYLAYKITEWRTNKLMPRSLPQDLHEWSKPVPEEERAKPSEELQKANEQIRTLRQKNPRLTPQQLLEEFYRSSREQDTLLA
jgi:hypothetical protein